MHSSIACCVNRRLGRDNAVVLYMSFLIRLTLKIWITAISLFVVSWVISRLVTRQDASASQVSLFHFFVFFERNLLPYPIASIGFQKRREAMKRGFLLNVPSRESIRPGPSLPLMTSCREIEPSQPLPWSDTRSA